MSCFRSAYRSVDTLLRQLWTIPSALSDVLIAIAMIILVSISTVLLFFLIHLRTRLTFLQLSRMRVTGTRFTVFVMVRVVRLTIETNALTGTFFLHPTLYGRPPHPQCHLPAGVAFSCFVLQVAFPVRLL